MGNVWVPVALVVVAGFVIVAGFASHVPAYLVIGFILLAIAGVAGVKGNLPESH